MFVLVLSSTAFLSVLAGAQGPQAVGTPNPQSAGGPRCRIDGHVTSGTVPLPGVSIVVQAGGVVIAATSTDIDGKYTIAFSPNASYHLAADLTAFTHAERDLTVAHPPCDETVDFQLALASRRVPLAAPVQADAETDRATRGQTAAQPAPTGRRPQAGQPGQRFRTLTVQPDANGAAAPEAASQENPEDVARLLPPGFSVQTAQADAITVEGRGDASSLDRALLNDRQQIIRLGELDPVTGQFAAGFGPQAGVPGGPGGQTGVLAGGSDGRGGFAGPGGRGGGPGGRGGPGGFVLGGRGARAQSPYQGTATYTFGGSAFDAAPYQLRPEVPVTQPQFSQNTFGTTVGGPLKIPGLYQDTNRRTNFQLNYTGNHSNNLFDQYATVPTQAMRAGDFSGSSIQLFDPRTGQPFPANQIPASQLDPAAVFLTGFIPVPNLPGTQNNYHVSTTALSSSEAVSLRLTQNLSPMIGQGGPQRGRGGPGGRGGGGGGFGFGGRGGGAGGRGGATNIVLNAQLQYRRNDAQSLNVFPGLGSEATGTSIAAPVSLNVVRGRTIHNFTVNFTHSRTAATNAFSGIQNVGEEAGINYPIPTDPLNWGVPTLVFSGFNSLRGPAASVRTDSRITTSYFWLHPIGKHQLRFGADYRFDSTSSQSNGNARGSFTFTGLYSGAGSPLAARNGADFADFLLGAPQQAALQVGGVTHLHGKAFDAYVEDNWQKSAKLTLNLGLRYELVTPYVEINGQMANLDAAAGFLAVAPVVSAGTGPFTGEFPAGLIDTDINNVGPRVGFAYRMAAGTILRGGYSITYNPGSYAAIARQLVAQPPFAQTETVLGSAFAPLTLSDALLSPSTSTTATTMNNYGVDRNYSLGQIQTWNANLTKNLNPVWAVVAGYTGVKGADLDLLSAPNRGPSGLLIPAVQPFIWESSGGRSLMNAGNFQLLRRLANGVSGSVSYTLAKSMDDTPTLGSGGAIVAQNPHDLEAEWALSNFDRRHQFSSNLFVELPFGPNRRWLRDGGRLAEIFGSWSASLAFTAQSGTPLTARVVGAASNVAQGISGALRADYTGAPIAVSDPTLLRFFNTAAFAVPGANAFGDSGRNVIIGPGGHQLNGSLSRDMRLGGNRAVTLQINATNVLNTVQWASVDANINSKTFGQVIAVRPMRAVTANVRFRF